jgi:RTX calcium-binding nonapeptide repeat (4 copies)
MTKLARTIPVAALVSVGLMVAPPGAGAATTIGETFAPTGTPLTCGANFTRLQVASVGDSYVVPTDGVITQWSFQAPTAANVPTQSPMSLKAARPTGGISYQVIGESTPLVTPVAGILNTYFTRVPVKAGDIIGDYTQTGTWCLRPQTGYTDRFVVGDVKPPTQTDFTELREGTQFDLAAVLESDCDNDGLGDETQDSNLSSCAPGTIPPPAPGPGGTTVTCKGLPATIVGTDGNDARTGSLGRDVIAGLGGNDTLSGLGGKDVICGGAGRDLLKGGKGADSLLGQKGKDTLKGGGGKDLCKGGKGKDTASGCEVEKSI